MERASFPAVPAGCSAFRQGPCVYVGAASADVCGRREIVVRQQGGECGSGLVGVNRHEAIRRASGPRRPAPAPLI